MKKILYFVPLCLLGCANVEIQTLKPIPGADVTDIDGNTYHTVQIGDQVWMTENLRALHYADGAAIPVAGTPYVTTTYPDAYQKGAMCFLPDEEHQSAGVYYNWAAVTRSTDCQSASPTSADKTQGPCPKGWRVPSAADWTTLINNLGGIDKAGGYLKTLTDWNLPNTGATNASMMAVLPSAQYILSGEMVEKGKTNGFDDYGYYAMLWTASEGNIWSGNALYLNYQIESVIFQDNAKTAGVCLRCIMDSIIDAHSQQPNE